MQDLSEFLYRSQVMGFAVTLGNFAIWLGLAAAVACTLCYWGGMLRLVRAARGAEPVPAANGGKNGNGKKNGEAELPTPRATLWGRRFFIATCAFAIVGSLALWTLIFTQNYNIAYIWANSNKAIAPGFRFASFWSNQEGTFFLWALYNAVIGWVFLRRSRPDEAWVMPFFTLVNVSLFTLLTFMNPFWHHSPEQVRTDLKEMGVPESMLGFLPAGLGQQIAYYLGWGQYVEMRDGKGLNEQLQNFWMVIHPPTLFVGYSSMMVPSCFALGALMRRDYDGWVSRAFPWLLFSWLILGIGIFLGAYWAYETLGWGGYWSWDPVENSSIIPWVVGTALLHGMVAQRNRGNFKQANLFLGAFTGVAVLLGSFLVRSGVLSDVSVHSFASPQQSVFNTLLTILILWFVVSLIIWVVRFRDIQSEIAYENVWERHFGFFLGLIVLTAMGLVITFGVTMPVWKPWITPGAETTSVEHTFYNRALLPVTFMMAVLMAITPLMPWKQVREKARPLKPFTITVLVLSGLLTLAFGVCAVHAWRNGFRSHTDTPPGFANDPAYLVFGLMLAVALATNCVCGWRALRGGFLNTGPWVAHIGFCVMMAGIVITTRFKQVHNVERLDLGESVTVLGRTFTFRGQREAASPRDRDRLLIDMEYRGRTTNLAPRLFVSKISGQTMAWPQILHEGFNDLYVEPSGVDTTGAVRLTDVKKFEEAPVDGEPIMPRGVIVQHRRSSPQDQVTVEFLGLDTSEMQRTMKSVDHESGKMPEGFRLWADARVTINGEVHVVRPAVHVHFEGEGLHWDPIPIVIQGLNQPTRYVFQFEKTNLQPGKLTADFAFVPDEKVNQGYFQVYHVPGIQVLWFGCYLLFAGGFIAWRRRVQLARKAALDPETKKVPQAADRPVPGRQRVPVATATSLE